MTRPILVHSLDDALAALEAAGDGAVTLASAPGAAGFAGVSWWCAVKFRATERFPRAEATFMLDCGDAPGHVLGALRGGLTDLIFTGTGPERSALEAMAGLMRARLHDRPAESLDLRGVRDPVSACRDWLYGRG
ncbi:MAG TPA: hypothetical protein VED40_19375 [Azospirillaceae bacterium]|nr:hypothetical protein [Azospirillaceae bacterium]